MKHRMKRCLAFLLCLVMLCTLLPGLSARAEEIELIPIDEEPGEEIVIVGEEGPAEETEAVGNGDGVTKYRALLIGEVNFSWETANRNKGDVTLLKNMLGTVRGPNGGSYSVTCKYDMSNSGLKSAISSTFSAADDDDVSLFFIATHGVVDVASGAYAGELLLIGDDSYNEYMTLGELATCLKAVPGKVIVLLGSCGSGAAIYSSGGEHSFAVDNSGESDAIFSEAVIRAFAEADELQPNTGEFRDSKFYVLTAAAHQESSWGQESDDPYNYFPYYFAAGAGSGFPADANGNGTITLSEMYDYVYDNAYGPYYDGSDYYYQHAQVYPTGSSYALFSAAVKPVITKQPVNTTINAGDTLRLTVAASNATGYQWYWRKNSSSSWSESTVSTAQKATLVYTNLSTAKNGYQYRCKVSNSAGYVYTNTVTLTVKEAALPTITKQPVNTTINAGDTLRLTVAADNATGYQWYWRKNSSSSWSESTVSTAQKATLVYTNLSTAKNGYQYRCKVSNGAGYVYTNTVTLTVKEAALPTITTQPKDLTISAGGNASFTVKATNALSYQWQWRKSSSDSWKDSTVSTATTATLKYSNLGADKTGRQYRCKVSNNSGFVYTNIVTLTVKSGAKPTITTQPSSMTKYQDYTADFMVLAENATGYQWYYRTSSSGSWNKCTGAEATSAVMSIEAKSFRNGYQYRCKVSNANGYVYTNAVTLTVNPATYRALLIGEVSFSWDNATRNRGDVNNMKTLLNSVKGPKGGSYSITCKYDQTNSGIKSAISKAFAGADDNDVSLFFIATHGYIDIKTGSSAGMLCTVDAYGNEGTITMAELAECLKAVPGKVIVLFSSCGSGAAIANNGAVSNADDLVNRAFIQAFADADETLPPLQEGVISNTGEFRNSKFYVMTAAAHLEESWGREYAERTPDGFNYFPLYMKQGATGSKPADSNGDGTITLKELYNYVYPLCYDAGPFFSEYYQAYVYQHVQVYPTNSSYELFK
ncbi:MAG: immunoglobulin domain-containing protein [Oscillospiraceae bacterium]|nr:immunoglobulin domain-containing protein [Oscillospiraceae bacterium]